MWAWPDHIQALKSRDVPGRIDLTLLLAVLALALLGLVMVASASMAIAEGDGVSPFYHLIRHSVFLLLGCALAAVMLALPMAFFERHSRLALLIGLLLLCLVLTPGIGRTINGATRWINLGITTFQAVEAVKLLLVIYLASYAVRFGIALRTSLMGLLKPLAIVALIGILLVAQPDFGSAVLIVAIAAGMLWVGGARLRDVALMAGIVVPGLIAVAIAEPYRVERLKSFLDPWADPFDDGFQLTQALIAIGRGEVGGVGLGSSVQKLFYLPEAHTDFILAVIAEELGLVGVALILGLFALILWRTFKIGLGAIEHGLPFAGYVACGIGTSIGVQALVSIGVNLGVLPTKGLTLPLVSAGGSSLLMSLAAMGLVLRASLELSRRQQVEATQQALAPDELSMLAEQLRPRPQTLGLADLAYIAGALRGGAEPPSDAGIFAKRKVPA